MVFLAVFAFFNHSLVSGTAHDEGNVAALINIDEISSEPQSR